MPKNEARARCILGISRGHYRLGNGCDFYGAFRRSQTGTSDSGVPGPDWPGVGSAAVSQ